MLNSVPAIEQHAASSRTSCPARGARRPRMDRDSLSAPLSAMRAGTTLECDLRVLRSSATLLRFTLKRVIRRTRHSASNP